MTFLCGEDMAAGVQQHERGVGWPEPWHLRCNGCGAVFEYHAHVIVNVQQVGNDEHLCSPCRRAPAGQMVMQFDASA